MAAVIVTHNSAPEIARCLRSLAGVDEIVVVDNASSDSTVDAARQARPDARIVANRDNRGFAAAVNQGVRSTRAPLIALLNPDVELCGPLSAESPVAQTALQAEVGLVGGRLDDENGDYQQGFGVRALPTPGMLIAEILLLNRLWPGNPWNRRWRRAELDPTVPQACEQPAGAFWVFRRETFDLVGGMDEGFYPLWFEDVDFCRRMIDAGFQVRYEPEPRAIHAGGHSLRSLSARARHLAWYRNLLRFSRKHYSRSADWAVRAATFAGLAMRALAGFAGLGKRGDGRACLQTIRSLIQLPDAVFGATRGDLGRTPAA
ncbi:MAG: glycosyltransferase family 2 protein [Bryobacterales bacterium]|nr:glycosyltransferase family 2 protein [Acidobacteriota bacterium]MCB9383890.1 glycosyltransferase family 2 protein [Bryobacterales bacterium]